MGEVNKNDLRILKRLIRRQNRNGAMLNTDPFSLPYQWNNGRLTELYLGRSGLTGTLDVSGLDALEVLFCGGNALTGLNLSGCIALKQLGCPENRIKSIEAELPALLMLNCEDNPIEELSLSGLRAVPKVYGWTDKREGVGEQEKEEEYERE